MRMQPSVRPPLHRHTSRDFPTTTRRAPCLSSYPICPPPFPPSHVSHCTWLPYQPDWLVEDYEGQLPCLVDSKEAYTESANIVDYIEYFYPEPTLSIKDSDAVAKVGEGRGQGMVGAFSRL